MYSLSWSHFLIKDIFNFGKKICKQDNSIFLIYSNENSCRWSAQIIADLRCKNIRTKAVFTVANDPFDYLKTAKGINWFWVLRFTHWNLDWKIARLKMETICICSVSISKLFELKMSAINSCGISITYIKTGLCFAFFLK